MLRRHAADLFAAARGIRRLSRPAASPDDTTSGPKPPEIDLTTPSPLPCDPTASRQLVIHIGFHKTGTSAIQELLFDNRIRLLTNGVVYPQPEGDHPSHLDLATALGFNPRPDELEQLVPDQVIDRYRQLVNDAPEGSTVIISSEEFCQGNFFPDAMENLKSFLATLDAAVTIVAYTRDPVEFLLSIYHHELRDVDTTTRFDQWISSISPRTADFHGRLQIWHELMADRAEIIVRDYEAIRQSGNSVVADLLETAGLDGLDITPGERRSNVGVHPMLVEAYIAVRASNQPHDKKLAYFNELQAISKLMPKVDGAAFHLGQQGKAELQERLKLAATSTT